MVNKKTITNILDLIIKEYDDINKCKVEYDSFTNKVVTTDLDNINEDSKYLHLIYCIFLLFKILV